MRLIAGMAAVAALSLANAAHAGAIAVTSAWIPEPPPGARTAAGYGAIINHGPTTDRLMGGRSAVAASVDVHEMSMAGGVMRMRPVPGGLPIGASATVDLGPRASHHLMLVGLKAPLKPGQHVKVVLQFRRAGSVVVDFVVRDQGGGAMHM